MSTMNKINTENILLAKSINEAITAYNHECEHCMAARCRDNCPATRMFDRVVSDPKFAMEMKNPDTRRMVNQYRD